jgi:glucose-1-phosphate adenylyltransferase
MTASQFLDERTDMKDVVTIILAGGQGSRLYPLTKVRSKPAVPIAGKFRLIDVSISNCLHSGFRRIFVLTQFSSESLHRHIFTTYRFDSFHRDFITVLSAQQTLENRNWYEGTADAVRKNLSFIENKGGLVLILSGDHLYRMDYTEFVESHLRNGAEISIAVTPVREERVHEFGVMKVDATGRITDFREKPADPAEREAMRAGKDVFEKFGAAAQGRTHLASMGIYLFDGEVLGALLNRTGHPDFGRQVIPAAIRERKVFAHFFDGYWEDIGTIPSFFEAHMDLVSDSPRFHFYDEERPIYTHPRFLPGSKILSSEVERSILCEGSLVRSSRIRESIIGIRSLIGERSTVERTIMMGADYFEDAPPLAPGRPAVGIGRDCEIRNTILDKNARIGDGVRLINAGDAADRVEGDCVIVNGIIVVPKDAVIPDGTVI